MLPALPAPAVATAGDPAVSELARFAVRTAVFAADKYLRVHRLRAETGALESCVMAHVKIAMPQALADGKAALACGMDDAAVRTFAASMALAGIEAAKEAGFPRA